MGYLQASLIGDKLDLGCSHAISKRTAKATYAFSFTVSLKSVFQARR